MRRRAWVFVIALTAGAAASAYYTQLVSLAERGDGSRPELREARAFLGSR
jgi:hypothetical protein